MPIDPLAPVLHYHAATKHRHDRSARAPGGLDWATQPNPFRSYEGAELLQLPLFESDTPRRFDEIVHESSTPGAPPNERTLSTFLRYAMGLSAIKQAGESRWALRMNPSSGNLHPTEAHLLCGPLPGWREQGFVAHYAPDRHALEVRAPIAADTWRTASNDWPAGTFFIALSSIFWREAWKYGERAYRYCQHDLGHAIAALSYSASCLGWNVRLVDHLGSDEIASLFGLHSFGEAEPEEADTVLAIFPACDATTPRFTAENLASLTAEQFAGQANTLSPEHIDWDAIDLCAAHASKPATPPLSPVQRVPSQTGCRSPELAHTIIAQRRSAVSMDGKTRMSSEAFFGILQRCMPTQASVPYESFPWSPRVHLALFVHRVDGLVPGLYLLERESESGARLLSALSTTYRPEPVADAPAGLPLHLLHATSMQSRAAFISCGQDIAGLGTFSLGMLAEVDAPLAEHGPWYYPRLYWETGLIGQTLYLEAEAAGLRGTGIGCFFDDSMHELLGLRGTAFQSLYHFTIGGPVEDSRIQTAQPYADLRTS